MKIIVPLLFGLAAMLFMIAFAVVGAAAGAFFFGDLGAGLGATAGLAAPFVFNDFGRKTEKPNREP